MRLTETQEPARRETRVPHVRPTPIPEEREFGLGEMFFSTTNRKGIIRSGNSVFARVSAYSREVLVGSPHNIIRHPDMPRVVFKLLWEEIEAGRPFAGYVKNMAGDGRYYWVMASVLPCADGYLSVRIKPSTPFLAIAQSIYTDLLALEREVESGNPHRRKASMEASQARLEDLLRAAGYDGYEAFMRAALLAEVRSRQVALNGSVGQPPAMRPVGSDPALGSILRACTALGSFLASLVAKLDQYGSINQQLGEKARIVRDLADDVGLFAMNALIAAARVGEGSASLGAVARLMQSQAVISAPVFQGLTDDVNAGVALLASLFYPIAATTLQADMLMAFVHELLDASASIKATGDDLGALAGCLADQAEQLVGGLARLGTHLHSLGTHIDRLKSDLKIMRALELQGRVEAAQIEQVEAVVGLFHTMAGQIAAAYRDMQELQRLSSFSFADEMVQAQRSLAHVATIRACVSTLNL